MDPLVFYQLQTVYYLKAANLALLCCEFFQTFEQEVKYIWSSKWTSTKIIYILSRYTAFVDLTVKIIIVKLPSPPIQLCLGLFDVETCVTALGMASAQVFFCIRAYALWGPSRASFLFLMFIAVLIGAVAIVLTVLIGVATRGFAGSGLPGCIYTQSTAATLVYALVAAAVFSAAVDIILMVMILLARSRRFKNDESPLIRRIYRDAILYFGVQLVIHVTAVILWVTLPGPLKDIPPSLPRVMISIVTTRTILHIREFGAEDGYPTGAPSALPMSTIQFRPEGHGDKTIEQTT